MAPTPAEETAPLLLEVDEPSLPWRPRLVVSFGVFALVGIGAVFAFVVRPPLPFTEAAFEEVAVELVGTVTIPFQQGAGDDFKITAEGLDTIDNVKVKIQEKIGVPTKMQTLWLKDAELEGDRTVDECGIDSSTLVTMVETRTCGNDAKQEGSMRRARRVLEIQAKEMTNHDGGVIWTSFKPDSENMIWHLTLKGPAGSPYDGGNFPLTMLFPKNYPFGPPTLKFDDPIYHVNCASDGTVCLGLVSKTSYKPSTKASAIVVALQHLLKDPEIAEAARPELADLLLNNKAEYKKNVKEWTENHVS